MFDIIEKRPDVIEDPVTQELRDLIQVVSWTDEQFAEELRTNRGAAVSALIERIGFDVGDLDLDLVSDFEIPESPIGASPVEIHALDDTEKLPGTVNSYTADCGCSDTTTGGCSCGSVFGTPCLACATVLLC